MGEDNKEENDMGEELQGVAENIKNGILLTANPPSIVIEIERGTSGKYGHKVRIEGPLANRDEYYDILKIAVDRNEAIIKEASV